MADAHVLIIEDDADINEIVATRLARAGMTSTQAFSGTEARLVLDASAAGPGFSLVICDLMLPGLTGEELVSLIRARDQELPIIVISARTDASDKIDLLRLGADDYLTKPFDLDELVARIEVQLRRRSRGGSGRPAKGGALTFRSWELDPAARSFCAAGEAVELTRLEFKIVEILMGTPGRAWSKQELFERAWGEPYAADDNTLNVHISNIRTKLRASGTDGYIKTVWGMGFKLSE
ncbi:MAG: response regulator transcription factor [Coriobacteriaceae bacterium]|nr:response regulator transcription factor [Coriobacteriaceae bacterium]